jgi:hypothetical protein
MENINTVDYKINIENDIEETNNSDNTACCILRNIDHNILLFCTQILFSLMTMSFCIYKLCTTSDPAITSIYLPLLSSIVTLWLPSPQLKQKKIIK